MHVANCEYLLLCKMNAHQSLFVVDLNERRGDRTYLVWSIVSLQVNVDDVWLELIRLILVSVSVLFRTFYVSR